MIKLFNQFFSKLFFVHCLLYFSIASNAQSARSQTNYDVKFYRLDLAVTDTSTFIDGSTTILIEAKNNTDTIILNLGSQLVVSNVSVDLSVEDFEQKGDSLYIYATGLSAGQFVSLEISYSGDGYDKDYNGALFNRTNQYGKYTFTLTEPFGSKYWFPCKEVLSDKADSVYVYITVPNELKAGANGILVGTESVGTDHTKFKWQSKYPVSFYLISIAVGNYIDYTFNVDLNDTIKNLPVVNYVYNSNNYFNSVKSDIDKTGELLQTFSNHFGVYPFYREKYGHSQAPIGGGMEHQTMTTLVNFGFELVAHELAHQWFGDLVTCKYWNDIWVNEGIASYCEYLAVDELMGKEAGGNWMNNAQNYALELPDGSVYVPEALIADEDRIFDYRLSYKKGAAIMHMIRYELKNDSLFFNIMQEYLNRFAFSSATGIDFKNVLEELSGKDFTNFFNEWYFGEGYPILDVNWFQLNDTLYINTNQTTSAPEVTGFFHLNLQYKVVYPIGDTTIQIQHNSPEEFIKIYMPYPVYDVIIDPDNYILKKVNISQLTDTGDLQNKSLLIFPNPANDKITIFSRSINEPLVVEIFDQKGMSTCSYMNINPFSSIIPIDNLSSGIYYMRITFNKKVETVKLVKK